MPRDAHNGKLGAGSRSLESLSTVLDSLDDVAEPLRGYYREEDGRFVLSLAEPKAHPAFRTLKQTADRLDRELKEARRALDGANERLAGGPDEVERAEYARLKERGGLILLGDLLLLRCP